MKEFTIIYPDGTEREVNIPKETIYLGRIMILIKPIDGQIVNGSSCRNYDIVEMSEDKEYVWVEEIEE